MACALSSLVAAGCYGGPELDRLRELGELGQGAFYYLCADDTDAACNPGGYAEFPSALAVDGRFALQFGGFEREVGTIEPASQTFMQQDGAGLVATSPGLVAVLARDAADARVLDFKHFAVRAATGLRIDDVKPSPAVDADWTSPSVIGDTFILAAAPTATNGTWLGGTRDEPYRWSVADDAVLWIGDPWGRFVKVGVAGYGSTEITVRSGELTATKTIHIASPHADMPDAGDAGRATLDDDAGRSQEDSDGGR